MCKFVDTSMCQLNITFLSRSSAELRPGPPSRDQPNSAPANRAKTPAAAGYGRNIRGVDLFVVLAQQTEFSQLYIQRLPRQPQHFGSRHPVVARQINRSLDAHLFDNIGGLGYNVFQR